jgi:hypothetical protein
MTITALLTRLGALEARLDARRRAEAAGQLALDLTGGAPAAGKGPGGGEKCGGGWIDPKKTCRKGEGGDPIDRPYEAKRSKPKETIVFPEPIVGPTGAKLTAYTWQWTLTEDVDHRGEPVEKRVSDWEKSIANVETGRNVVHQFQVEVGGETRTVSAESALKLMGFLSETDRKAFGSLKSSARTVARLRMAQQELDQQEKRWQKDWDEVGAMPRPPLEVGEWSEEPPGWPREGYRRRSWRAGDVQQDQIWNQLGVDTDQEQAAHIWARWIAVEMEKRGWDYKGQGQTAMRGYLRRNREDLAKRLARAEAKLMAQTRSNPGGNENSHENDLRSQSLTGFSRVSRGGGIGATIRGIEATIRSDSADRIDSLLARLDALKRRCSTGYACGAACISIKKECRSQPTATTSRERISRLEQLAKGQIKPRGIGNPQPEEARALADKLRTERAEQQAVVKAERERHKAEAAKNGTRKPSVVVKLRRAKPGGEHGPDGHWYPGGAWMPEGNFVGAKPLDGKGQGDVPDQKEKPKDGREQRVVRPKRPSFPERPLKPKGEGLPRPTGLKKMATKNDETFFGDDGYIRYPQPKGAPGLAGSLFEAAVMQRMTTEELKWATEQIRQKVYASGRQDLREWFDDSQANIDDDITRYGGPEEFSKDDRWTARTQTIGIDAERYIAGRRFMSASRILSGDISAAQQRREERHRDPRFEDWIVPEHGEYDRWVWGLNNVFRAVRIRRGRA